MGSGASVYQPAAAELVLGAYARLQIRRTEITHQHLVDARLEAYLLQIEWGNKGPNLWTVDNQTIQVRPGQAVYDLPADTIDVLDAYFSLGLTAQPFDASDDANTDAAVPDMPVTGTGVVSTWTDRIVTGFSRSEFTSLPNKQTPGTPSVFWFQKAVAPKIYFWPVPDQAGLFGYWRTRRIQDPQFAGAVTADIPYLWQDASVAGLAYRLSRIYKPEIEAARKSDAAEAWVAAASQDTEDVPWQIAPDISGYYD